MVDRRLIVLKFGGSVLRDEAMLRRAVHEIHRWRRGGYRVVAVVSALAGTTDQLLGSCRRIADGAADHAVAAVVAGGELHCASLLGLFLDRAGIPARALSPGAIGLVAEGRALDAQPRLLDPRPILRALDADEVVILPGYAGHDAQGRMVLFGRGGSDLTAFFVAGRLRASRCRLVKDVDGLYERDPAAPGPPPARYASVSWDDALATDGSIVQHKAVRFARSHGIAFEVGCTNDGRPTLVCAGPTLTDPEREMRRPLRLALLGLGTVGGGLIELLGGLPELFEVTAVAVRDPHRLRGLNLRPGLLTTDAAAAVRGVDIVAEAMGGTSPARSLLELALDGGAHVVTANKAVVALAGETLAAAARQQGISFLHSAAVGGSTPLLERLAREPEGVGRVRGVLNGTVNFILDGLAAGREIAAGLDGARKHGFVESDAERDLSGRDAADKLAITARVLGRHLDPDAVECDPLEDATAHRARRAAEAGLTLRQVSTLWIERGRVRARVAFEELAPTDSLAAVRGEHNAAVIERARGVREWVSGKGAGRWPTAEALLGDLLQIARERGVPRADAEQSEDRRLSDAV